MSDEQLARALLASDRPALVQVWCPGRRDRLGKVYAMPDGAPVLCVPAFRLRMQDLAPGRPAGPLAEFLAGAYRLDGDRDVYARCKHGTFLVQLADLRARVERSRAEGRTVDTIGSWTGHPGWTG